MMRMKMFRTPRPLATAALLALLATPAAGLAQMEHTIAKKGDLATKFLIDEADPAASIPSERQRDQDPLEFGYWLQDMIARGESAFEKGDWPTAAKYYDALRQAMPESVASYRRLCSAYRANGDTDRALASCREALSKQRAIVQDHLHYVDTALSLEPLPAAEQAVVEKSLSHLRAHAAQHPQALPGEVAPTPTDTLAAMTEADRKADPDKVFRLKVAEALAKAAETPAEPTSGNKMHLPTQIELFSCKLGVKTGDAARLGECAKRLREYRFPDPLIVPFVWAREIAKGDREGAAKVLALAESQGVPKAALERMRAEQARAFDPEPSTVGNPSWLLAVAALIAVVIGVFAFVRNRRQATA